MNICMIAYSFYEYDARVRKYSEMLVKNGHNVDVIALSSEGQSYHNTLNGVNIFRIQQRERNEKAKTSYLYRLIKFLLKSSYELSKKHLRKPYDIIHVHSVPDFEVFAAIIPKVMGAKVILDIHDPVPDLFMANFGVSENSIYVKILKILEWVSTKFSDHVITITDYWKDVIAERSNIPNNKISVILNLPDKKIFNPDLFDRSEKVNTNFTLLYPGMLNRHCGVDVAIRAVKIVKDEIPLKFMIYGTGSSYDEFSKMVKDLDLEEVVIFNAYVPWQSVPKLMYDSDVGIALMSGDTEYSQQGLCVKAFEFLAMGIPVIATKAKSTIYYLGEDTVLLSELNDPVDVARCIREIYYNETKRNLIKEKGLEFIEKNNADTEMNKYLRIIDEITK